MDNEIIFFPADKDGNSNIKKYLNNELPVKDAEWIYGVLIIYSDTGRLTTHGYVLQNTANEQLIIVKVKEIKPKKGETVIYSYNATTPFLLNRFTESIDSGYHTTAKEAVLIAVKKQLEIINNNTLTIDSLLNHLPDLANSHSKFIQISINKLIEKYNVIKYILNIATK